MFPAKQMFARKIILVFDKLQPGRKIKSWHGTKSTIKFNARDKFFFSECTKLEKKIGKVVKLTKWCMSYKVKIGDLKDI